MWLSVGNVDRSRQSSCVRVTSVGSTTPGGNEERGVEVNCLLQDGQGNTMKRSGDRTGLEFPLQPLQA